MSSAGIRAYEQLGYRAFGTPGKMAAGIAITLQNIGGESEMQMTDVYMSDWFQNTIKIINN